MIKRVISKKKIDVQPAKSNSQNRVRETSPIDYQVLKLGSL